MTSVEYLTGVSYVTLTQGKVAIIDSNLGHSLNKFKWTYNIKGEKGHYAHRMCGKDEGRLTKFVSMHRFVWESVYGKIPEDMQIDHINGNGLDNRIENLRVVTNRQNNQNKRCHREGTTTSQYMGVSWSKARGKWVAHIHLAGKSYYLGLYVLEEEAHQAYIKALEDYTERGIKPDKRRNL